MRIAVAVDWSDQAFDTVRSIAHLYQPQEVILIHAVDLHPFENPLLAPPVAKPGVRRVPAGDAGCRP